MPLKDLVSIVKDGAVGLREVVLVVLLAVLLFNPPVLVGWLKNSQLEKVGVFGISFEARQEAEASREQGLAAATQVQAVDQRTKVTELKVSQLSATLDRTLSAAAQAPAGAPLPAAARADLRELARQVDAVKEEVEKTRKAARTAQAGARNAVIAQTRVVEKAGGTVQRAGWVWVGQIDPQSGQLRDVGEPETVAAPASLDPQRLPGGEVRFTATTYIYREPFDGASQPSAIVGVAPKGRTAKVADARLMRFRREGLPRRDPNDQILWVRIDPS